MCSCDVRPNPQRSACMKSPIRSLFFTLSAAFAPFTAHAQPSPVAPAAAPTPALTSAQLNEGLKSGFTLIVSQALVPTSIKVPTPKVVTKAGAALAKNGKEAMLADFNKALAEVVAKSAPKAVDLIKNSTKDLKVTDAQALLTGPSDGCTTLFRKTVKDSVRDGLLQVVKQASTGAGLVAKARTLLTESHPQGLNAVDGGARTLVDMEDSVCNQIIDQCFKLIAQKEATVRANPSLLTGNALAQKVFEAYKK